MLSFPDLHPKGPSTHDHKNSPLTRGIFLPTPRSTCEQVILPEPDRPFPAAAPPRPRHRGDAVPAGASCGAGPPGTAAAGQPAPELHLPSLPQLSPAPAAPAQRHIPPGDPRDGASQHREDFTKRRSRESWGTSCWEPSGEGLSPTEVLCFSGRF